MRIAVDFDGTLVREAGRTYLTDASFITLPGALEWCREQKAAGHKLILYSCRANLSKRKDPKLDPLRTFASDDWWPEVHERRYRHMLDWVAENAPGLFDYIDDGTQGKVPADLYVDDRAITPPWMKP